MDQFLRVAWQQSWDFVPSLLYHGDAYSLKCKADVHLDRALDTIIKD